VKLTDCPLTTGSPLAELVTLTVATARATSSVADPVLVAKSGSPEYLAATVNGLPDARRPLEREQVATPPLRGCVFDVSHEGVDPSVPVIANVTVPDGDPVDGLTGATAAMKLTGCPVCVGFELGVTTVFVGPKWMILESIPVLPANVGSPE
jgi:hypothetical protein